MKILIRQHTKCPPFASSTRLLTTSQLTLDHYPEAASPWHVPLQFARGVKNFGKVFAGRGGWGVRHFYFGWGAGNIDGGWSWNFEVKIKIASQYHYKEYFWYDMSQVFGTLCCFSSRTFLKQLASHVFADTLQLKFPGIKFFLIHPGNWNIFWKVLKFFVQCKWKTSNHT